MCYCGYAAWFMVVRLPLLWAGFAVFVLGLLLSVG